MNKLPSFLYEKLIKQYGIELTNEIISGYTNKFTTLRVNTLKTSLKNMIDVLDENNISYEKVSWYSDALIITENEYLITKLSIYEEGLIYLQSLSSMIPVLVLDPKPNMSILDMAAAPGGKTTQISAMTNNTAVITACEKNKIRLDRLKYNLDKQGTKKVGVIQIDSRKLDDYLCFDSILLDAPCSGSGTLSLEDPKLEKRISLELINNSSKLQYELLTKAIRLLNPGCEMVYSTCSILKEENDDVVKKILKNNSNIELVPINKNMFDNVKFLPSLDNTICICPNKYFEGFFVAKFKRKY